MKPSRPVAFLRGGAWQAASLWLCNAVACSLAGLIVALAVGVVLHLLLVVRLLTFAVVAGLLLAARLDPATAALTWRGVPSWLAAAGGGVRWS